jgi:hypothetical protein
MSQQELLKFVISKLNELSIEFMLSGSHASSLQGEARATHDIDLVANLTINDAKPIIDAFQDERFYLSESAVREAIKAKRMFNLLETTTGEEVDFWVLTETPFDQSRFQRRQQIEYDDLLVCVTSPEDTMLMKLVWSKKIGGSEKQLNDVVHVYELQAGLLDMDYLDRWVKELEIEELWDRVIAEADPIIPPN